MGLKDVWDGVKSTVSEMLVERLMASPDVVLEKAGPRRNDRVDAEIPPSADGVEELAGLLADPFALIETMGYRERYSAVSYDVLNRMAYHVPIYPAILQTRRSQVASFCHPQTDRSLPGFRIGLRDRRKQSSKKEQVKFQELEEWVVSTGSSKQLTRDPFENAVRKLVRDSMVYDQVASECVKNRKGKICDWYVLDGSSIRIADTAWKDGPRDDNDVHYVQVHDETVIAEFTPEQLAFAVRNPRSDLRVNGYGESGLEMGIKIGTALVNGWSYNAKFFENGTVAKGLLNIPDIPQQKLRIFSQQWHMMTSGILNSWRTPMTNFKDLKWVDLERSARDMEWGAFIDFCIKLFCGIELIDPTELHFNYGNSGQTQQMFQAPAEQKIKYSKDKGLRPLLSFFESYFNRYLIWRIDPDLSFYFTGVDPRDSEQAVGIESKQVTYLKTVNELRTENDLPPLSDEEGNIILNPVWLQNRQALQQQQMMAEQQEQQGEEGPPEGEEGQPEQQSEGQSPDEDEGDWSALMDQAEKSLSDDETIGGQITYELEW